MGSWCGGPAPTPSSCSASRALGNDHLLASRVSLDLRGSRACCPTFDRPRWSDRRGGPFFPPRHLFPQESPTMNMLASAQTMTRGDLRKAFDDYSEAHGHELAMLALERSTGAREVRKPQ